MSSVTPDGFVPLRTLIPWPEDLVSFPVTGEDELGMLDRVGLVSWEVDESDPTRDVYRAGIGLLDEVSLELPGLDGFGLVIGAPEPGSTGIGTQFTIAVGIGDPVSFGIEDVDVALRMRQDLLRPVERAEDGAWKVVADQAFELRLEGLGITFDTDGHVAVTFEGGVPSISMPAFTVGDSGIVVEADEPVQLHIAPGSTPPPGQSPGWRGVHIPHAAVHLPQLDFPAAPSGLEFTDCSIGSGGFTGDLDVTWAAGAVAGSLLGVDFELRHVGLDFIQNAPVEVEVGGQVTLPFFDQPVAVEIGFGIDGSVTAALAAVQPPDVKVQSGLVTFTKPGLMSVTVDGLGLEFGPGRFEAKIGGRIKLELGDVEWPEVTIRELAIDQDGHVRIEGGWLDLDKGYGLEFYGFRFDITKLGLGHSDDGGRWVGFSGALKLVEGMPAGASVEGLRVTWYDDGRDPRLTLAGVGVEFEVPGAVRFKGEVSYREFQSGAELVRRFDGAISLDITAIGLEIDAGLVIGTAEGPDGTYTFFAIFLGVELPAGIPLGATGIGLYGFAGLFALNMEPNRRPDERWYGVGPSDGWYKRPQIGVTDLRNKWDNQRGSIALGVGTTLGTVSDNGYTFAGRVLLVLILPGPIIMVEGKANLLKERATLSQDPLFRLLAVLDFRAGQVLIGLDVHYKQDTGGELIDITGGTEAFFDFHDSDAWHIYLGEKEPIERRIRANLFQLFEANAYVMLDARGLAMGAWIGYDKNWTFGPLGIDLEAWLEGGADLNFKPPHLTGYLWLHGKVAVKVFGIGFTLVADARATADVFDPMKLVLELSVKVDLPWPLPDAGADLTLQWGPTPTAPPMPLPLKEVAVEHLKATTSWPLPRVGSPSLLLPSYDDGQGFVGSPTGPTQPADLDDLPVVPLDARPHLTFGRSVHDQALVGVNAQPVHPGADPAGWEWIGDPVKNEGPVRARFRLTEIALERYTGSGWSRVAQAPEVAGVDKLFGSWAPVPQLPSGVPAAGSPGPVGNTKLWLWSKSAYDYTRSAGRSWDEAFGDAHPGYPCVLAPPDRHLCCDFQALALGTQVASPWKCERHPEVELEWTGEPGVVAALAAPLEGVGRALCFPAGTEVTITIPSGGTGVTVTTPPPVGGDDGWVRRCVAFAGEPPDGSVWDGLTLDVRDAHGTALPLSVETLGGARAGLHSGWELTVTLPTPADGVELDLSVYSPPVEVTALDASGRVVDRAVVHDRRVGVRVRLSGQGIAQVVITANQDEALLHELCTSTPTLTVTVDDPRAEVRRKDGTVRVIAAEGSTVRLGAVAGTCIARVCVDLGPDPAAVAQQSLLDQHLRSELQRWSEEGRVFEPHTRYRLRIVTEVDRDDGQTRTTLPAQVEHAYFRTEGPPGIAALSTPQGNPGEFASGLDDLSRYVDQTVPPTVPPVGDRPVLPRPVYRAYDVAVRFNENYVDQLYRSARRDLSLQLYDVNNQPLRDAAGALVIVGDQWGSTGAASLTESELRWVWAIESGSCAALDPTVVPRDRALTAAGHVLAPDAVHEARLVPLLVHEAFTASALSGWTTTDHAGSSTWWVRSHGRLSGAEATVAGAVVTLDGTSDLASVAPGVDVVELAADTARSTRRYTVAAVDAAARRLTLDGTPTVPGGSSAWELPPLGSLVQSATATTTLLTGDGGWTDLRVTAQVRVGAGAGVVVRATAPATGYRFTVHRTSRVRRLVRVVAGQVTLLAEDSFAPRPGLAYALTLEVVGPRLRAFVDGTPVFDVTDASAAALAAGAVALHADGPGAEFREVRVDDLRAEAPVVYRFKFTTSRFATFVHHLHSGDDRVRAVDADVSVTPPVDTEDEHRAFEALATTVLGGEAHRQLAALEVTAVSHDGATQGLLVEAAEPIDWSRTGLALAKATDDGEPVEPAARAAKLIGAAVGAAAPNDEWVDLLLRDTIDPGDVRVERRQLPGPLDEAAAGSVLFAPDLAGPERGLLHDEAFDANALDRYDLIDEEAPGPLGPSSWQLTGGAITHATNYVGAGASISGPYLPGTIALLKAGPWSDVRVAATLRSSDLDALGVVLRHDGAGSYYRFSMSRADWYRRLVKRSGGQVTVLWEDQGMYELDHSYRLVVEAYGDRLVGWLDEVLLFDVVDAELTSGRIGLYAFKNAGARFEALEVTSLERPPVLWHPPLADVAELSVEDQAGAPQGPSEWAAGGGVVTQSSPIGTPLRPGLRPARRRPLGTYAAGGDPEWTDIQATVRLHSAADGIIGLAFRYRGIGDHYRVVLDRSRSRRALERLAGGRTTELWSDGVAYDSGRDCDLTVRAEGPTLTVFLDGQLLCTVSDSAHPQGRVALHCAENPGAQFSRLLVADRSRSVAGWRIDDRGAGGPSAWRRHAGALEQTSTISATGAGELGTVAVAGPVLFDARLTARLRCDRLGTAGIAFRYAGPADHYRLDLDAHADRRRLVKAAGGTFTVLWEGPGSFTPGTPFTIELDTIGEHLVGRLDGRLLFDLADAAHPSGRLGVHASGQPGLRVERIVARRPPIETRALLRDHFAAGSTAGWTAVDDGNRFGPSAWALTGAELRQTSAITSGIRIWPPWLVWLADVAERGTQMVAGDRAWDDVVITARLRSSADGALGIVFRRQGDNDFYRFSMDRSAKRRRLVVCRNGTFTLLWEDAAGIDRDRPYDVAIAAVGPSLRGWIDGVPAFAVEDASLASGQVGLYCRAATDARFSNVLVFPADTRFRDWWLDESFAVEVPGRWAFASSGTGSPTWTLAGGELRQTGDAATTTAVATVEGAQSWQDYRVVVRLRTAGAGTIGALVRQSRSGYYLARLDAASGSGQLVRVAPADGTETVLWTGTISGLTTTRDHLLTIDCIGARLIAWLDARPLFSVHDDVLPGGTVGMRAESNPGACFAEIQVGPPVWVLHHELSDEHPSPAGTRLRLHAGSPDHPPIRVPNVDPRFAAPSGEVGRATIGARGARLRLIGPDVLPLHAITVRPATAYTEIPSDDLRVLRRADGTAFYLHRASGSLHPGTYRLSLTYRRDNRAIDPTAPVLSQATEAAAETATLDLHLP